MSVIEQCARAICMADKNVGGITKEEYANTLWPYYKDEVKAVLQCLSDNIDEEGKRRVMVEILQGAEDKLGIEATAENAIQAYLNFIKE